MNEIENLDFPIKIYLTEAQFKRYKFCLKQIAKEALKFKLDSFDESDTYGGVNNISIEVIK